MEREQDRQKDGAPHALQRSHHRAGGEEAAQIGQIAKHLRRLHCAALYRSRERRLQRRQVEPPDQGTSHRLKGERAYIFQDAVEDQAESREQRQHRQRVIAARVDDAIVHLQHEDGHGELQQRNEAAQGCRIGQTRHKTSGGQP